MAKLINPVTRFLVLLQRLHKKWLSDVAQGNFIHTAAFLTLCLRWIIQYRWIAKPKTSTNVVSQSVPTALSFSFIAIQPVLRQNTSMLQSSYNGESKADKGKLRWPVCFIAMMECKSKDITAPLVRDVKAAVDPALVLTMNQQLEDMQQVCTCADEFCAAKLIQLLTWEILMSHNWLIVIYYWERSSSMQDAVAFLTKCLKLGAHCVAVDQW